MNQFSGLSEEVGASLAARRQEVGASLRSIAADAEVSPSHLSDIEKGKSQVSLPVLLRLVRALDLTVSDLLPRIGGHRVQVGSIVDTPSSTTHLSHNELELGIEHRQLSAGEIMEIPNPYLSEVLVHLLTGEVAITADTVTYHLNSGDTFDSERLPVVAVTAQLPSAVLITYRNG